MGLSGTQIGEFTMERFLKQYQSQITGVLSGPDRVLFRGVLRSICYVRGLEIFLASIRVLNRDFMSYAERVSKSICEYAQEFAEKYGRPYEYVASSRASKEEIARKIALRDQIREGLVCVLGCVEPCTSVGVRRNRRQKRLDLVYQQRRCLHVYFYYIDREYGWMHVRLQTWFPFTIQVCINGREWLGQKMRRAGMSYQQQDNCFTQIGDIRKAQRWMDQLQNKRWASWLDRWARQVLAWLSSPDGSKLRGYYWTVRQAEFATDVMFLDSKTLDRIYPTLLRHAMEHFDSPQVLRFLGRKHLVQGESKTRMEKRREGVCVKHFLQENWIKMYNKQGSVLRIETTINNPRRFKVWRRVTRQGKQVELWAALRKGIADFRRRGQICLTANRRYLQALSFAVLPVTAHRTLDPVSKPCISEGRRYRALRPISPEDSQKLLLLQNGRFAIDGVRNRDLQSKWPDPIPNDPEGKRTAGRITRWLRLVTAHGLLSKIPRTQCYRLTLNGQAVITAAIRLRNADLQKLVA
jgi:hypothetical protein